VADGKFSNIDAATGLDDYVWPAPMPCRLHFGELGADAFNSIPTTAKLPTDCLGVALKQAAVTSCQASARALSVPWRICFYIGTHQATSSRRACIAKVNSVASTAQPLVENIEDP
jgi:hypothetical protein